MDKTTVLNTKHLINAVKSDLDAKRIDPFAASVVALNVGHFATQMVKERPLLDILNKDIRETMQTLLAIYKAYPEFSKNNLLTSGFFFAYSPTVENTYLEVLQLMNQNKEKGEVLKVFHFLDALSPLFDTYKKCLTFTDKDFTELAIRVEKYSPEIPEKDVEAKALEIQQQSQAA